MVWYVVIRNKSNALSRTIEAKVNVWIKLFEACKTGVNLYENPLTLCVLLLFLRDGKSDYIIEKLHTAPKKIFMFVTRIVCVLRKRSVGTNCSFHFEGLLRICYVLWSVTFHHGINCRIKRFWE